MIKNLRFSYHFLLTLISKKNKELIYVLIFFAVVLLVWNLLPSNSTGSAYKSLSSRIAKPTYIEGVVGSINTLNPVYEKSLAERELNYFVFRGISKVSEDGSVVPDLAESISKISDKIYRVKLKEDIYWHDGEPITSEDVIHTVELTQKPNPESSLSNNFKDVEVVKVDEETIEFILKEPFSPFLLNTTVRLVPKHISLEKYKPIGSGDFRVGEFEEDRITLESEKVKLVFKFYKTKEDAILALKLGEIDGLGALSFFDLEEFKFWPNINIYSSDQQQRQVVLFFNLQDKLLAEKEIRQSIGSSIPKDLVTKILPEFNIKISNTSLPLESWAESNGEVYSEYNLKSAIETLEKLGWKKEGDYFIQQGEVLTLTLKTSDDPEHQEVAQFVKDSLKTLGVAVNIETFTNKELKDQVIPERDFQSLLIIQELSVDPDQYSLWHSSQKNNANISSLSSDKVDKILEDGRRISDIKKRKESYQTFNRILADEVPAIFFYYPKYFWLVNKRVKNIQLESLIETSDRFNNVNDWQFVENLPYIR